MICGSGRKVGSLKRRVRSHLARWEMKNCTPLWREAHFQVKMYKAQHSRTTFGSWQWQVEKVHAVVVRSTFRSQKVQSTPFSDHFWKLTCRKSARCCGTKHISKSKVLNTDGLGPLLDVQMSFRMAGARGCAPCQKGAKREGLVAVSTTTTTTLHSATLQLQLQLQLHYTTLHYANEISLHSTTLHYSTCNYNYSCIYNCKTTTRH